jgi:cell division protein FtsI (penicillin-binding protein 3)
MPDSIDGIAGLKKGTLKNQQFNRNETYLAWSCIGYEHAIAPIQMLTFYNAIANDGKMVKPHIYEGEIEVINPQIADSASIKAMQYTLEGVVSRGLGKQADSDLTSTAGKSGTSLIYASEDEGIPNIYSVEFCGYFPSDAPKYSIIVNMIKPGYPASGGGMAGPVFKDIVDYMCEHFIKE